MATETRKLNLTLRVWRQASPNVAGRFDSYEAREIPDSASFLEMLDIVNEGILQKGEEPIAFDHDCREGICGMCSLVINGMPHGPHAGVTTCQLHMRSFRDGDTIWIEPFRSRAFPVIRDLVVNRGAFDRVMQAGGFVSVRTGSAPEANSIPVARPDADAAFSAATCIGCGACVAACKNGSAMLFVSAKVAHLNRLPQGKPEANRRVLAMVRQMDDEGFGNCTNQYECSAVCPKGISESYIRDMNRDYRRAVLQEALV